MSVTLMATADVMNLLYTTALTYAFIVGSPSPKEAITGSYSGCSKLVCRTYLKVQFTQN